MIPIYVTAPQARGAQRTYRYHVELLSKAVDEEGIPEREALLDLVVLEDTEAAIKEAIAEAGYLKDWRIIRHYTSEDGCCF